MPSAIIDQPAKTSLRPTRTSDRIPLERGKQPRDAGGDEQYRHQDGDAHPRDSRFRDAEDAEYQGNNTE